MKNIKILFGLILIVTLSIVSCDEATVEVDPIGDTEAGFFQNEEQMTMAVMGIYQKVTFFHTFRGGNWLSGIWLLPGDNLTTEGDHGYENFVGINAQDGKLGDFYRYAYQLIARANTVLQKIEENGDFAYSLEPELKDFHRGEALFLRSWMNFRLWNVYGSAAPLINERITNLDDAYPASSQGTELLDQAISDLAEAATLLPDSWDGGNKGRVTKNSALALQGKILVFRGTVSNSTSDFSDALTAFNAITGADLMPNYGDNFDAAKENNIESFFEFQANNQAQVNNPYLDNDAFSVVGDIGAYLGFYSKTPGWIGSNFYFASPEFVALVEGDPRAEYSIKVDAEKKINVVKYLRDGNRVDSWPQWTEVHRTNIRILRYADVLLLKAEAIIRSGGNAADAIALINQIRERARNSTTDGTMSEIPADLDVAETDSDLILEWIYNERRIELAFEEGHRWYDLRRRHLAGEIDLTNFDFNSAKPDFKFEAHNIYFPLPSNEVIQNKNLVQNTGY
ncbi:RagB/SusD family nutrient uptake outer membrane protein [uncultured Draconibacterium sp.]|uniref:RagB/SusD family nutrient uptake outer membrane protein n=1 Tax=uncultured Draconibacterium sp. TaxID=1573823 RepID=UPI0029C71B58|nr:RagB/SusD family nutrient uptake outer membrane protein [uncultured Draconibacterium sp.]